MEKLQFRIDDEPLKILCVGAHSDDIEIGCGATILSLLDRYRECEVLWVVLSGNEDRKSEAIRSAQKYLRSVNASQIETCSFGDGFFPNESAAIKEYFEDELKLFDPSVIFTHFRDDLHQDHRVVSELTRNTFRDNLILEYELLKYDGDLGRPNVFVPVSEAHCLEKITALMDGFPSQRSKHWFTEDAFWAMLRIRGVEAASPTKFAEAFHGNKLILT